MKRSLIRRPLWWLALACVLGAAAEALHPALAWSWVLMVALGCGWLWHWRVATLVGVSLALAVAGLEWRHGRDARWAQDLWSAGQGEWSGVVLEDARGDEKSWMAPVELEAGPAAVGARVWWQGRGEVPVAGARVKAEGRFRPAEPARNPGEFDRAQWLACEGCVAIYQQVHGVEASVRTGPVTRALAALRRDFRQRVAAGLPEESAEAAVIRAVVIGERPAGHPQVIEAFRDSGSLHVFSVSGLHVGMVAAIVWGIVSLLGLPRRQAIPVVLFLVFGYAWLCGGQPPAMRAAWMAAVFLGAFALRRQPDLLNALGVVLLALVLWDGRLLSQPGVQLSYGAVAAIGFGAPPLMRLLAPLQAIELYLPRQQMGPVARIAWWLRRWIVATLGVSVAAGLASLPLSAWHFGMMAPVSILGALLLLPLVFLLLVVGLASVVLSPVAEPVSMGLNRVNGVLADGCVQAAAWVAAIPGGHWQVGGVKGPALLIYDLPRGDGAACVVSSGQGGVLIDCGGTGSFRGVVAGSLQQLGIRPDAAVLTHPDGGHLGGGAAVWQTVPLRQALLPVRRARSESYRQWLEAAPQAGVKTLFADQVGSLPLADGATLEVLHAPDAWSAQVPADDRVLVTRLRWQGWSFLWLSDAGLATARELLDSGVDLRADVLVCGRHRRDRALDEDLLDAVAPRWLIVGNAREPESERIEPAMIACWRRQGIVVIDQAETGGLTVRTERGELEIEGFLTKKRKKFFVPR
ncbi:MAG TPA: ComEC/Rec2 family competence protein [Luteolibacter sp.]|nr:ComEC/Rec2 family competence protein [Luteolibacter sp.]